MKKIIIVGGGFAGINLAKEMANNKAYDVVLVDKNNYHFFPPLLYQVSTAFIESTNITYPFRRMFHDFKNVHFFLGEFLKVDAEENTISTSEGDLKFDYLVFAMGTQPNFFGNEQITKSSLPMKSIDDAINLRNHMLLQLEKATRAKTTAEKELYATTVIAGGGPTGVEIAGMLAEMAKHIIVEDYPEGIVKERKIYLIDGGDALLGPMSKKAQHSAYENLKRLGVEIMLNTRVKGYENNEVFLQGDKSIKSATLIWATGVIAPEIEGLPKEVFARGRRIKVDAYSRVEGKENLFVIGDQCLQGGDEEYPHGHPQLAQVAIQQGKNLAENFKKMAKAKELNPFKYHNKGSMAIISKYQAVVDLPKRGSFEGYFAWLVWLFIHLIPIAGFKNKLQLAFNWFWSFISNDATLRLIIRPGDNKSVK